MDLKATDRLLVAGPAEAAELRKFAAAVADGSVCALVPADAVASLRRDLRDITNILIVGADEDGAVPWVDGYFTRVIAAEMTPELQRVSSKT
jgi:hypothetical protein